MHETLKYYNQNADMFIAGTKEVDMTETRARFAAHLPDHAYVLDFGCGSGRDTKAFLDMGFRVDATDGSEEICARASEYTGIQVKKMLFQELDAYEKYDGIWACASILHLPKAELADVIAKIETALKTGGVLYTSFKYEDSEGMKNGRHFTCFTEETLNEFWRNASSMQIIDQWITQDVRPDRKDEKWINLLARRV